MKKLLLIYTICLLSSCTSIQNTKVNVGVNPKLAPTTLTDICKDDLLQNTKITITFSCTF